MSLNVLPAVLALNISLLMTVILFLVYNTEKSNKEVKYLALLCFATAVYVFGQIMLNNTIKVERAIFWHKFQHIGIILIIPVWINFVFKYIEKKSNIFILLMNWLSAVMLIFLYTTPFVISNEPYRYAGIYIQGKEGFLYYFLIVMLVASLLYGYFLLIKRYIANRGLHSYDLVMLLGTGAAISLGIHDLLTIVERGTETTLFEYGLTIMCISLMYSWIIGKGFYEKSVLKEAFNRYFSYPIIKKDGVILDSGEGVEMEVTVIFADIRGFTALSEELKPKEIVLILNKFLTSMAEIAEQYNGIIDKLIGDNVMAIFGVHKNDRTHVVSAVNAAIMMREKVKEIATEKLIKKNKILQIGIGINTGKVIVGNIGSAKRMSYSVVGDTVNVASRLQEMAKKNEILVTSKVLEKIKNTVRYEKIGKVDVRGKKKLVMIYNILGEKENGYQFCERSKNAKSKI